MYSISGEQVLYKETSGTRTTIDVQQLPAGAYAIIVEDYIGRSHSVKVVTGY
jgi:hypothetical protein